MTPMVELNALLMKMGEQPTYAVQYPVPPNDHTKNKPNHRFINNNNRILSVRVPNGVSIDYFTIFYANGLI